MSAHWSRIVERMYWLMRDCGMPRRTPEAELLFELFWMIEEHVKLHTGEDWSGSESEDSD